MSLYHLCKVKDNGDEIWLGTFDSQEKLLEAIPERPTLAVKDGRVVAVAANPKLGAYRVKTVELNVLRPDTGEIDLPDESITIEGDSGDLYGIAIKGGDLVACSCPDFVYHRAQAGEECKHLVRLKHDPLRWGLGSHSLRGGYSVYPIPGLPGTFLRSRFPVELY